MKASRASRLCSIPEHRPLRGEISRARVRVARALVISQASHPAVQSKKPADPFGSAGFIYPGSDLLSHCLAAAVSSALEGLTSVFGMGTGVTPPVWPPGIREESGDLLIC